jgi:hypothetical protein
VDLSAVIFVVLALAWAVYLIPKALKHHDELASDRLVEGHSDKVRILSRHGKAGQAEVVEVEVEHVDTVEKTTAPGRTAPARPVPARSMTRASARKAAQRRRRVLGVLVAALAIVWALTWFAYLPIWAPAVPGAVVVLFLVVARMSVRSMRDRSRSSHNAPAARRAAGAPDAPAVAAGAPAVAPDGPVAEIPLVSQDLVDLLAEDTVGVARQEIEAALADDGSLWDPLPVTLPTYVNKARARRTVRTIELTGINSSGHDQGDSVLAREAEDATAQPAPEGDSRRVAGA